MIFLKYTTEIQFKANSVVFSRLCQHYICV